MGDRVIRSGEGLAMLAKMRDICKEYPEVGEHVDGFGHTSFRVRGKPFVIMGEHEGGDPGISLKTSKETQEFLLMKDGGFYKTPYIGQHGWVSVRMADADWGEIAELVREAYGRAAPKSLRKTVTKES